MAVKVIYQTQSGYMLDGFIHDDDDYYILTPNNWNDYGYITLFDVQIIKDGEVYSGMTRRILFHDQDSDLISSNRLNEYLEINSNDLSMLNKEYKYISLGSDYEELRKLFPDDYITILDFLNDIIFLREKEPNNSLIELEKSDGFSNSLIRDQSSKKALEEEKYLLFPENYLESKDKDTLEKEDRFKFDFSFALAKKKYSYSFNFYHELLPSRINLLIGKNGSGKSLTLKVLSDYFINAESTKSKYNVKVKTPKNTDMLDVSSIGFITNTIVIAYNPYEVFTPYSTNIKDYQYLGFRRKQEFMESINLTRLNEIENGLEIAEVLHKVSDNDLKEIAKNDEENLYNPYKERLPSVISENFDWEEENVAETIDVYLDSIKKVITDIQLPEIITFNSLKKIYDIDFENSLHRDNSFLHQNDQSFREKSRLNDTLQYISLAIKGIDCIGLSLKDGVETEKYVEINQAGIEYLPEQRIILIKQNIDKEELPILNFDDFDKKVSFYDLKQEFYWLSSGQLVFGNLIINLLSMIKRESLIIIDEPENTLHPTFEIIFMNMLYEILDDYKSFCVIATHSAVLTREVPKEFVQIIDIDSDGQPQVIIPPFETLGSSLTKINNYIFNDFNDAPDSNKRYINFLSKLTVSYKSYDEFYDMFENTLSSEMLIMAKEYWDNND